jgi:hypothetical protein
MRSNWLPAWHGRVQKKKEVQGVEVKNQPKEPNSCAMITPPPQKKKRKEKKERS